MTAPGPTDHALPEAGQPLRILHLEDNELDHELVALSLDGDLPWPVEIERVEDEDAFLHALDTHRPHLVLSDYALPSYDGLSAFRAAHARAPHLPFIIVTGAMGEEVAVDTLRQGVTDYILKQRLERLAPSVKRAIAEADARDRRERAEQEVRQLNLSLQARLEEVERLRGIAEAQRQRLEQQARQLEEALNLQKTFLAETSHELRTPLTALLGYLRRAEREVGGSQTLQDAQRVAENMTRLVNDLLQLSRGELVQGIEMHFVNLGNIVRQVGRDYGVKATAPNAEIIGDPGRLTQVFVNLVSNAIRVCGSPDLVSLEVSQAGGQACAAVIDHGPGIPDHIKPRIFDKFYRGKEAGSTGLGLTIAQQVVHSHGGTIEVLDTPGGGATFHVCFPTPDEDEDDLEVGADLHGVTAEDRTP
ncbi:hybrid sensor histidine kinase/response regulator [Deinococcus metallilatus]|uniref:histidine kinase n=1 Tax=Deinococcus metallilatus TaxID=1211322 RepID=A0ABR6MTB5_9DEIO|nr:hybrid sensor histidine kinase/response regulator [Deinococcus metallilatus]MBB5295157.1 signal transduction histidine kinase [Deinococcus metallilatus]GMA14930.1 hybrid sensor histidine kinase/response regulator [Deinococcus metallilatus]